MKELAIKKINRMGHAGVIITTISKILVILCSLLIIVLAIRLFCIPKSLLSITTYSNVDVTVDPSGMEIRQTETEQNNTLESIKKLMSDGSFSIITNGTTIPLDSIPDDEQLTADNTYLVFHNNSEPNTFTTHNLAWFLISVLPYLIMTWITLFFAGRLCNAFRYCESPFEKSITRKMSTFAYSLIPWVFLSTIVNTIGNFLLNGSPQFTIQINIGMIFIILIIFALVFIFKYGAVLQQESDETL